MTVMTLMMLPERLVVLVGLGASSFSLAISNSSSGNTSVSRFLSALCSTHAGIGSGLSLLCRNLVLLSQSKSLIGSGLSPLHSWRPRRTTGFRRNGADATREGVAGMILPRILR